MTAARTDKTRTRPKDPWTRWGILELGCTALFVGLAAQLLGGSEENTGLLLGASLALWPALIWLVYIYRQDRVAPEPWGAVMGVFILGALIAAAIVIPFSSEIFEVDVWRHQDGVSSWVADLAIIGTLQQLGVYLAVRYSVYGTAEFDEPVDGVIYASAASLGMATVMNLSFVLTGDGVLPLAGASMIACTTLVHVTSASILGYGMGRARFEVHGQRWLAICFLISILVHGISTQLIDAVGTNGATFDPWMALLTSLGLGAIVLMVTHLMIRRLYAQALTSGGSHDG